MGLQLPEYIKNAKNHGPLDLEIAGEGERVELSEGRPVSYNPPASKPVVPDWSAFKSIRHLFFKTGYEVYPAWLYHPTEKPKLVENQAEAAALGVCFRKANFDEKARYGLDEVWDWEPGCVWRPQPYAKAGRTVDANTAEHGKQFVPSEPNRMVAQNALIEALIPTVTAAVVMALKSTGPAAPSHVDPKQWEEFLAFQAFRKTQETVTATVEAISAEADADLDLQGGALSGVSNTLSPDQERFLYEEEAKRLNIKIDGRWSLERLKSEVDKITKAQED